MTVPRPCSAAHKGAGRATGDGEVARSPAAAPEPFDLLGPLPEGTTVLEASAGTGKTFTIANLVARYVADGVAMEELLVVSFSRESTRELRERVRERLVTRPRRAGRPGVDPAADDPVLAHLADADAAEVAVRRRRLEEALTVFDAATVTTTHGFCQQVLLALGTAGDHDTGAVLVENIGDLVAEVADDLYLRKWGAAGRGAGRHVAGRVPRARAGRGHRPGHRRCCRRRRPTGCPGSAPGSPPRCAPRSTGASGASSSSTTTTCCSGCANTLADPTSGPVAKARLRARYRVVLVDEFQDTDPVQWTILREAFHGHRTLVLIGDPKQAIYGFRGADVHAYLEARATASVVRTLPTQLAQRRGAARRDGGRVRRRGARRRADPGAAGRGRAHRPAGRASRCRVQLRVLPRDGLAADQERHRRAPGRPATSSRATWPARS